MVDLESKIGRAHSMYKEIQDLEMEKVDGFDDLMSFVCFYEKVFQMAESARYLYHKQLLQKEHIDMKDLFLYWYTTL